MECPICGKPSSHGKCIVCILCPPTKKDFQIILQRARSRAKKKNICFALTEVILRRKWREQQGVCPYTGWYLRPASLVKGPRDQRLASLDRINSSLGYTDKNTQFVAYQVNIARSDYLEEDNQEFFKAIAKNNRFTI